MKQCTKCKVKKPLSEFHKKSKAKSGLNPRCKVCVGEDTKKYYNSNRDKILKKSNEYRTNNRDKINKKKREYSKYKWENNLWSDEYKEKRRIQAKKWRENNPDRVKKYNKNYKSNNKDISCKINADRRAKKLKATLSGKYSEELKTFYKDIKNIQWLSEEKLEVDHIIPLKGDNVCGLHVPWNLQVLTKSQNSSKTNKFDGSYDNNTWRKDVKS